MPPCPFRRPTAHGPPRLSSCMPIVHAAPLLEALTTAALPADMSRAPRAKLLHELQHQPGNGTRCAPREPIPRCCAKFNTNRAPTPAALRGKQQQRCLPAVAKRTCRKPRYRRRPRYQLIACSAVVATALFTGILTTERPSRGRAPGQGLREH